MKFQEEITKALTLVNKDEYYIIFIDGKATHTNIDNEDCLITVDYDFDGDDYYRHERPNQEKEIDNFLDYISTIIINNNFNLKIIHLNQHKKYIGYNIIVRQNRKANIVNIYREIDNEVKYKFSLLCENNSQVNIKSFANCHRSIVTIANAYCLENAYLNLDDLYLNGNESYHLANVFLIAENSVAKMTNVVINTSGMTQSFDYDIYHLSQKTTSQINNYGISDNNSILIYNNKGKIFKNAFLSDLSQQTKGIILDLYSSISANPILEIEENDVKANHGASIGAIDEKDLYYLMSRGLTREDSEALLIAAFIAPYFRHLQDEKLHNYITSEANNKLYRK